METFLLAKEADKDSMIKDRSFKNALLLGPAVLAPLRNVSMANNGFEVAPEALFIEVPENQRTSGVIGLQDVTFEECTFQNVAIIGTADTIEQFRAGITSAPDSQDTPPSSTVPGS